MVRFGRAFCLCHAFCLSTKRSAKWNHLEIYTWTDLLNWCHLVTGRSICFSETLYLASCLGFGYSFLWCTLLSHHILTFKSFKALYLKPNKALQNKAFKLRGKFSLIMIRSSNQQKCTVLRKAENWTNFSLEWVQCCKKMYTVVRGAFSLEWAQCCKQFLLSHHRIQLKTRMAKVHCSEREAKI